jgi:hypothetical protein
MTSRAAWGGILGETRTRGKPPDSQSTSMALLMQLSAHFQHEVHAMLLITTGRPLLISRISSGQTMAHTPVLSQRSVSMETLTDGLH